MPLHSENKVMGRVEFDGFDDAIDWRDGADQQTVADNLDCLVVAGVDQGFGGRALRDEAGQTRAGRNADGVSLGDVVSRAVIDGGLEVLDERAVEPDVQGLHSAADGEDGLVETEGVLEEKLVDGGAGWVG